MFVSEAKESGAAQGKLWTYLSMYTIAGTVNTTLRTHWTADAIRAGLKGVSNGWKPWQATAGYLRDDR